MNGEPSSSVPAPAGPVGTTPTSDGAARERLLVVEDERSDAVIVLALIAEGMGPVETVCVSRLADALDAIRAESVSCVLLDLGLPDADDMEGLTQILGVAPDMPVVVLTGNEDEAVGLRAVPSGAQDYLVKGRATAPLLVKAIRYAMQRAETNRAKARLAAIVDTSEDAILTKALDGTIRSWNRGAERMYGYSASEVVGRNISLLFPLERRDEVESILTRIINGERVEHIESQRVRKDGSVFDVSVQVSPIIEGARIVGASAIARDITARKKAEDRVRFQAHLLDAVGESVIATDLARTIIYWNPAAERMWGHTAHEAIGRPLRDIIPSLSAAWDAGNVTGGDEGAQSWTRVIPMTRPDGRSFLVEMTNTPVFNVTGAVVAIIAIASDVTERERANGHLQRLLTERTGQATEAAAVVELGRLALAGCNAGELIEKAVALVGTTLSTERVALLEFGTQEHTLIVGAVHPPDSAAGSRFLVVSGRAWKEAVSARLPVVLDGKACAEAFELADTDSTGAWATVTVRQRPFGGLVVCTDNANRLFADHELHFLAAVANVIGSVLEREQLDAVKSDFVSTVSHELRTPVTSVLGYLEVLTSGEAGDVSAEQQRMLATIERNGKRLLTLIEDLLTVSRIESGTLRMAFSAVEVDQLVRSALTTVAPALSGRTLKLVMDAKADAAVVMGDAEHLERALVNLIINAVKFTPDGGTVAVRSAITGSNVTICVDDTGVGIPEDEQQHLFSRFFRASTARSGAVPGTGLGLSIVKSILDSHGGTVSVRSSPGTGTSVMLTLPLAHQPSDRVAV